MRLTFIVITLLVSLYSYSQVKKLDAETTVQQVTIFSSGARVNRSASVSLQAGRTEITFPGLSNQLDPQTVQLQADANITLLSVQTTKDYLTVRKIDQEEKDLIGRSNEFKDKLDLDSKLMEVYKNEEAMLIKNQAIDGEAGIKAIDLKESLDLQRARLTEVYGKELEIQKRLISDQQNFDKTNWQLQDISKKKDSVSFMVSALVDSKEIRTIHFQLLYNVKDAGWFPAYDVRVNELTEPLNLLMNANVYQRSGETWKNISLLLSTGNPNDNATPSSLEPWRLGFYDPSFTFRQQGAPGVISGRITDEKNQPVEGASVLMKGMNYGVVSDVNGFFRLQHISTFSSIIISRIGYIQKEVAVRPGYLTIALQPSGSGLNEVVVTGYSSEMQGELAGLSVAKAKMNMDDAIQTVAVTTRFQPTTIIYKIDEKYNLETDGKTTTIGIKQFGIPAIYDYYTAPKTDPNAFLTAKITNWQDYHLQSGEISLYFEGTYLGKTYLDLASVTDTLALSLGKDNSVKLSRNLVRESSSKKFIGNSRTETKEYEMIVHNTKSVPVTIELVDQFPVSTNKEISVEDIKAPDGQIDKDTGIVTWTLTLLPGQERKLGIGYSIKYPKDKKVVLE